MNLISKKPDFDVKLGLKHYLPSLIDLIQGEFAWSSLNKLWNKQHIENLKKFEGEGSLTLRVTLLSLTALADKIKDENSIRFLNFMDSVFKNLAIHLDFEERKIIKSNLFDLLIYYNDFLNYLGEFFVLNCLLTTGAYKLIKSECNLKKGKVSIDFNLLHLKSNKNVYIEVINIEITEKHLTDNLTLEKHLRGKLESKLIAKDKSGLDYTLIPVLWTVSTENNENLFKTISFFEETKFSIDRVHVPYVYHRFNYNDEPIERFSSILECYKM